MERIINYTYLAKQLMLMHEKHEAVIKLTRSQILENYGDSDIQFIDTIGRLENPNVTKIAQQMKMTGGAISKIAKRLMDDGSIRKYQIPENRKEVYFALTDKGIDLFRASEKGLREWYDQKNSFFDTVSSEKLVVFSEIIDDFNSYMENHIKSHH